MELKDYVKTTLISITEAVYEAKIAMADKVAIAPFNLVREDETKEQMQISSVDFEVELLVSENATGKQTAKATLKVLSGNLEKNESDHQQKTNRLKFSVPVHFGAILKSKSTP
jgi:hypothetical protein